MILQTSFSQDFERNAVVVIKLIRKIDRISDRTAARWNFFQDATMLKATVLMATVQKANSAHGNSAHGNSADGQH